MCYKITKFHSNNERNNNENVAQRIAYNAIDITTDFHKPMVLSN